MNSDARYLEVEKVDVLVLLKVFSSAVRGDRLVLRPEESERFNEIYLDLKHLREDFEYCEFVDRVIRDVVDVSDDEFVEEMVVFSEE